jgi:acylphosphatase
MALIRAHVFVSGRVQGVFYRSTARSEAKARGLVGWVRNLSDGRVEAVFEGESDSVKNMLKWCRQGPENAFVEGLDVSWEKPTGEFKTFDMRY